MSSEKKQYRTSSEIESQLEEVRSMIAAEPPASGYAKASWFESRSTQNHLKELETELNESITNELADGDLSLSLSGDPVKGYRVQADFLGAMLTRAQGLVNAVAQSFERATARGTIAPGIVEENRLYVDGFFASSFGIRFKLDGAEDLGRIPGSNREEVLDAVGKLLDPATSQADVLPILRRSSRVRSKYREFVDTVAKSGAQVVARTQRARHGVRLTASQARDRAVWLDTINEQSRTLPPVAGILAGGDVISRRFHLEAKDGAFRGEVATEAIDQLHKVHLGDKVIATIQEITEHAEDGQPEGTPAYLLVGISGARSRKAKSRKPK